MKKKTNQLPKGWTETKVQRVLRHYEGQTADAAVAEDEDAYRNRKQSLIAVPVSMVPAVRRLISRRSA